MRQLFRLPQLWLGTFLTVQVATLYAWLTGDALMRRALVPVRVRDRR